MIKYSYTVRSRMPAMVRVGRAGRTVDLLVIHDQIP